MAYRELGVVGRGQGNSKVTAWLAKQNDLTFAVYAIVAAFSTYFCVYAFRKPFTVASFNGTVDIPFIGGVDYKILLIIAQVMGYALSKFIGIRVVSEMAATHRAFAIVILLGLSQLALVLFGMVAKPYNVLFIFANGVPLGSCWGLVFGFLEGRRLSEVLGAGLSASYIVASGFVKTVGRWFLDAGVSEHWMPAVVGFAFAPIALFSVWMLSKLPPPTPLDEALRVKREPMSKQSRQAFLTAYAPGLFFLTVLYVMLTALRDFRDNFARELWDALGYGHMPSILTSTEIPVAFGVLVALAMVMWVQNNRAALMLVHGIMLVGTLLIGVSTFLFQVGVMGPVGWMVLVGLGLYIAYVPFGCVLFDRLIAAVGFVGTSGFMIYVADACGYLGSVVILLYRNFGGPTVPWVPFFVQFSYATSILATVCFGFSMIYFYRLTRPKAVPPHVDNLSPHAKAA